MAKLLNKLMTQELTNELKGVDCFVLFGYEGLKSEDAQQFRSKLGEKKIHVKVLKNNIASIVFKELCKKDFSDMLKGGVAMAYGGESPVDVAKAVFEWSKKVKVITVKGGYLCGQRLNTKQVDELSKSPNKKETLGMFAGAIQNPMQQIATMLINGMQSIGYALNDLIDKMEKKAGEANQ